MKNMINWFALPVTDLKRAVKFYNSIFDFKMNVTKMGETEMAFFPAEEGSVSGHLFVSTKSKPTLEGPYLYLNGGEDLKVILDKVESAGGKIISSKTEISPEIGFMAVFTDSEGNKLALHSPK